MCAQPEPEVGHELSVLLAGAMERAKALHCLLGEMGRDDEGTLVSAFIGLCKMMQNTTDAP